MASRVLELRTSWEQIPIGRRVCAQNWYALRAVGESANRCLCDAEAADAQPAPDVATFIQVTRPSTTEDGLYAPGLRFGEARVMALLGALVGFCHLVAGFCNPQMVERVRALGAAPYTARQATYDLRRLKRKGLIVKTRGFPSLSTHESRPYGSGAVHEPLRSGAGSRLERTGSAPARRGWGAESPHQGLGQLRTHP